VVGETAGDQDRRGLPARQPLRRGPALVGASVELVFDPFDLTRIEVRYQGRAMGAAAPTVIGRHVHPAAKPEMPAPPRTPTGIDYLGLVEQRLAAEGRQRISYALLADQPKPPRRSDQRGGQAELPGIATTSDAHADIGGHTDGADLPTATSTTTDQPTITDDHKETRWLSVCAHYGFSRSPFGRDLAPQCCTPTTVRPKPSPASPG